MLCGCSVGGWAEAEQCLAGFSLSSWRVEDSRALALKAQKLKSYCSNNAVAERRKSLIFEMGERVGLAHARSQLIPMQGV